MVAVALMPPLVACGMLLGEGKWLLSLGALLLVAANVICVNIAGVATFALQGVRPRTWWEAKKAKNATIKAGLILFILFVVLGGLLVFRWPTVKWFHIPAVLWGVLIEFSGWICPLTPLENKLRIAGGKNGYTGAIYA